MQIEVLSMQISNREKKNAISLFKLPRGLRERMQMKNSFKW
jgi:hypothetical protein